MALKNDKKAQSYMQEKAADVSVPTERKVAREAHSHRTHHASSTSGNGPRDPSMVSPRGTTGDDLEETMDWKEKELHEVPSVSPGSVDTGVVVQENENENDATRKRVPSSMGSGSPMAKRSRMRTRSQEMKGCTAAEVEAMDVENSGQDTKDKCLKAGADVGRRPGDTRGPVILSDEEMTGRIAKLIAKNEQLTTDIDSLKRSFSLREEQTNRLLLGLSTLNKMENELLDLQQGYQESSRKNVALIQEALLTYCSTTVENLKRCGNMTSIQLLNFRKECNEEMGTLLNRLEEMEAQNKHNETVSTSATLTEEEREEMQLLKKEITACRMQLDEIEPRREATENEMFHRMEAFCRQLESLRQQMARLEQDLSQENQTCHRSLENLLSRQIGHFQQQEMDEMRSDMCEILKEMHLLKERTKYLNPNTMPTYDKLVVKRSVPGRGSGHTMGGSSNNLDGWTNCSSYHCGYSQGRDDRSRSNSHRRHDHHYCHFHCPHIAAARAAGFFPSEKPKRKQLESKTAK